MGWRVLADAVLVFHGLFIVFAVLGGPLVLRWRALLWPHLACALWAATVVSMGWLCPLTPLEQHLRALAGQQGYSGGFVEHYLLAAIYPEGLTRGVQVALGLGVLVINAFAYALIWRKFNKNSP